MVANELHQDRARAESFGAAAEAYDRRRKPPPAALIDDLAALEPGRVLDVGCGTGKAAVALAERGLAVLGVEPDERMAAIARRHGIDVEVATFEAWQDDGRRFDLLTFAESWHWIDPGAGVEKAARVLRTGGTIARIRGHCVLDGTVIDALDVVYREYAPEVAQVWRPVADQTLLHGGPAESELFTADGAFHSLQTRTYRWERVVTAEEWIAGIATVSDHQRLGPNRLAPLLRELRQAIERLGGTIRAHNEAHLMLARRA